MSRRRRSQRRVLLDTNVWRYVADEGAGPVRRVELVAGEGQEVDPVTPHVDRRVRRQLRRVHQEARAEPMCHLRDLGNRPDLAGHVARTGHGHQVRVLAVRQLLEGGGEALEHGRGRLRHPQVAHADPLPRQEVGVVLAGERDDVRALRQGASQQVDRVRGVAGDDHRVVVAAVHEAADRFARSLVGGGGCP